MLRQCRSHPLPQRAVITGASSGIGTAFAHALPEASLLLTGRNDEALHQLATELRAGSDREILTVEADLAQASGRARLVETAAAFHPDLLVNDAGTGSFGPFLESEREREEETVLVNALAPMALTRALLPGMLDRAEAEGHRCGLLNVASSLAFTPTPNAAVYAATKSFLLSLTEALALELSGRPIDLLAVCPGPVRTDFARRAGFPGGQLPFAKDPDEVARLALGALGRRTVVFTDSANALAFRAAADLRSIAGHGLGLATRGFSTAQSRRSS
jgi:short-subunit dehydrogenase